MSERPSRSPLTPLAALVFLLALAAAVLVPLEWTDAPQDDSYISYIYARNFAEGHGLVYNRGEEPVEGYTNFSWTLLLGLGMKAGLSPEWLAPRMGLACTLLTVLLTGVLTLRLGGSPWFAALAALLFAVRPTQTIHAIGGLETPLFCLLLLCGLLPRLAYPRGRVADLGSALALALATLTRPEGAMLFVLLEAGDLVRSRAAGTGLAGWFRSAWPRGALFGLLVGAHVAWRFTYYGDWVPNTFHAKVDPGWSVWAGGLDYVRRAVQYFGPALLLLPYLFLAHRTARWPRLVVLVVSSVYSAYVIYVGGDYIPAYRYLLPVMPLWCALAASSLSLAGDTLAASAPRRGPLLAGLTLLVLSGFNTWSEYRQDHSWAEQAERHAQLKAAGELLGRVFPEDAWLAVTAAGRVPWFAERRAVDMMGLSDRHIALQQEKSVGDPKVAGHLKGDGDYVLDRDPDAILFLRLMVMPGPLARKDNWLQVADSQAFGISEQEIARSPRFRQRYELWSIPLEGAPGYLNVFVRKSRLPEPAPPDLVRRS